MKSLMIFFVLVASTYGRHLEEGGAGDAAKRENIHNLLTQPADHVHYCKKNKDCENDLQAPICDVTLGICKARNAPSIEFIYGSCMNDNDCRPLYRCHHTKCHFSGPKSCDTEADCLRGVGNLYFQCKEEKHSLRGSRCWLRCEKDRDCYQCDGRKCRISSEEQKNLGCCEGFCQKKLACDAASNSLGDDYDTATSSNPEWHSHPISSADEEYTTPNVIYGQEE